MNGEGEVVTGDNGDMVQEPGTLEPDVSLPGGDMDSTDQDRCMYRSFLHNLEIHE